MSDINEYFRIRYKNEAKRNDVWRAVVDWLEGNFGKAEKALDIAAGRCSIINALSAKEKWAIDINPNLETYADISVKTLSGDAIEKLSEITIDFDQIFISNFLEHVSKEYAANLLNLCRKRMKKNGKLYIIQPNFRYAAKKYFDDYTHETIYSHISLCDFLTANSFKIIKSIPKFLPLTFESKLKLFSSLTPGYLKLPLKPFAKQMLVVAEPK